MIPHFVDCGVTPYTGVWIETKVPVNPIVIAAVTPYTGVWIETRIPMHSRIPMQSHPTRVCGLKHDGVRRD